MLARRSLAVSQGPRVEQSPTPTINRERVLINFSVIPQFCRRGGAWLRPPLPYPLAQKIFPRTAGVPAGPKNIFPHRWRACWPKKYFPAPLACLQCRPLQAKSKAYAKILLLFQNFIVGASIARPPLPCLLAQKIFPRTVAGLPCRPLQAKGKAYAKILSLFLNFIVGASIARPLKPCAAPRPPGGAEPHPYHKPRESAYKF